MTKQDRAKLQKLLKDSPFILVLHSTTKNKTSIIYNVFSKKETIKVFKILSKWK